MVYSLRWLLSRGDQHVKHTSMHQNFGKTTVLKSSGITLFMADAALEAEIYLN